MFSMKYTSPRVTPKKGAAPTPTPSSSTSSPLDRRISTGASASSAAHKRSKSEGHALPSADSIRGNYGGNNDDDGGVHDILLDLKASESITNFNESATNNEPLLEPSAVEAGCQQQLTQDIIIANISSSSNNNNHRLNNYAASILSENDSAVANVNVSSQQLLMGPSKSNLLALLDKEYNNDSVVKSSNSGEKNSNKEEMKQHYHKIGIDPNGGNGAEGIAEADSVGTDQQHQQEEVVGDIYKENENSNEPQSEECNEQQIDDENDFDQTNDDTTATVEKEVEDDVDLDDIDDHHNNPDASTYTPNSHKRSCLHHHSTKSTKEEEERQSSSSSSIKLLPKGLSLHETTSGSYEYRRTESMEPLLFDAHREDHSARTTATSPSFIKEENYLGPFENNDGGVLANQTQQREATNNHNDAERDTIQCTDPTSPIIYDMSNQQPASPLMSVIDSGNEDSLPAGEKMFNPTTMALLSPAITEVTTSEIGGDTYFDKPAIHLNDNDLVHHVTLPPRVNRTTTMNTKESSLSTTPPFLTNCPISAQQAIIPGPIPMKRQKNPLPFSPRQPLFSHTHSLLDDCSEDEEEENNNNNNNNNNSTSYTIVDSPTRHMNPSYGCIPRHQRSNSDVSSSSPFSLYFNKKGGQQKKKRTSSSTSSRNVPNQSNQQVPGGNANKVASNNIQQALLQTRHRRWDCQSAYAGSHAQSNQIFDISNRVVHYHLAGYNNHNISSSMKNNDGPMAAAARLSVSVEAVRAAALASGLWRTVRLAKLPKGLFGSYHSATSTNNNSNSLDHHTPQQQQHRDDNTDEVWSLLKMLHFTFPSLEQIDFAGDIISRAIMNGNNDNDKMANNDGDDNDWRDELLTCIMECLPNIIAIDGFVIEQEAVVSRGGDVCDDEKVQMSPDPALGRHKKDITQNKNNNNNSPGEDNEESKAARVGETSVVCVDCEEVPMCGLDFGADGVHILNDDASASNNEGEPATDRHSSENVVTTSTKAHNDSETAVAIDGSPSHDESMEDMRKVPLLSSSSSMLSSSSRSWESNGSGRTRPPRPNSATSQRPRIPSKPKKSKGLKFVGASGRLKRQVLGLIPTVSMMDEEEDEEEDSDDSEEIVEKDECPSDIL